MTTDPTPLRFDEIAKMMRAYPAALLAEVGVLPEPLLIWRPGPDEWCVNEVLGHLIEAEERGFAGRVRTLLTTPDPLFQTWDPPEVARSRHDDQRPAGELLSSFLEARLSSAVLVESLTGADLPRSGTHPVVGRLTVGDLLAEWVHHDREHLRQILANVQGYVWHQMGGAKGFKPGPIT
jgi:hypothetical protein